MCDIAVLEVSRDSTKVNFTIHLAVTSILFIDIVKQLYMCN